MEQEYTPKKATPPAAKAHGTATGGTSIGTGMRTVNRSHILFESGVSKNGLKRLKQRFLGKRHTFYVDDWVEKNFPRSLAEGETEVWLMGEFDAEVFSNTPHSVHTVVDVVQLFGDSLPEDFSTQLYHGVIVEITMDRKLGEYRFVVDSIKTFSKVDVKKTMDTVLATTQGRWNAETPPTMH